MFKKFIAWLQLLFIPKKEPISQTYNIPYIPVVEPEQFRPTKAYADQRQKSKRKRRRKPSKVMANLYKLKG